MNKKVFALLVGAVGLIGAASARDIPVGELPRPVLSSIQKAHKGAKLIKAEEDNEHGAILYEVKVELKDHTRRELEIRPDGTIVKTENSD